MAESLQMEIGGKNYFCHQCRLEINPKLPEYTCPRCDSGFIEEVFQNSEEDDELHRTEAEPSTRDVSLPLVDRSQSNVWERLNQRQSGIARILENLLTGNQDAAEEERSNSMQILFPNQHFETDMYMRSGLSDILSQMVNQLAAAGPAPSSQSEIDALPRLRASATEITAGSQCSVCMDCFTLDESVTPLPCTHMFHTDCIIPWLQLHSTCPVCRHCSSPSAAALRLSGGAPSVNQVRRGGVRQRRSSIPLLPDWQARVLHDTSAEAQAQLPSTSSKRDQTLVYERPHSSSTLNNDLPNIRSGVPDTAGTVVAVGQQLTHQDNGEVAQQRISDRDTREEALQNVQASSSHHASERPQSVEMPCDQTGAEDPQQTSALNQNMDITSVNTDISTESHDENVTDDN